MTRFGVDSYAYSMLAAGHIDLVVESGLGFYDIAALIPSSAVLYVEATKEWQWKALRRWR